MKFTLYKILLAILIAINTFSIFAMSPSDYYTLFTNLQFFGFPRGSMPSQAEIDQKHRQLLRQYHPDKATNFLDRKRYDNYAKQINSEYKSGMYPSHDTMVEIITFDLIAATKKYAKNPAIGSGDYDNLYDRIRGYFNVKLKPFEIFLYVSSGLVNISKKQPLGLDEKNLVNDTKTALQDKITVAKSKDIESRKRILTDAIYEAFNVSYLDQNIRDIIVQSIIDLAEEYKKKDNKATALILINEMLEIIDQEWNVGFPINPALKTTLNTLKAQLEKKEIPQTVLQNIDKQLNAARTQTWPTQFGPIYQQIILTLNNYLPESSTRILGVYYIWTDRFVKLNDWPSAKQAIDYAVNTGVPRLEKSLPLPDGFAQARKKLQDQLSEINKKLSTPPPTPMVDLSALSRQLQQLKDQLEKLSKNLGT